MTEYERACNIRDYINDIRYKEDDWSNMSIINYYFDELDELGYDYDRSEYDITPINDTIYDGY